MKPLNVLLVNPWIHDFAAYDLWARPIGLLRLGRLLKNAGCSVHLLDLLNHGSVTEVDAIVRQKLRRDPSGRGRFYRRIIEKPPVLSHVPRNYSRYGLPPWYAARLMNDIPSPDLVMVTSTMTYWYTGVRETISFVREKWPAATVVLGGVYATLCPDHARRNCGADFVFTGRVEGRIDLLNEIPGMEGCFGSGLRDEDWPLPAVELYHQLEGIPLATTRGCPFRCPYCSSMMLSGNYIARNPRESALEILHWHSRTGAGHFAFFDDALLHRAGEHFLVLAEEISGLGLPVSFHAPNGLYVDAVDINVARAMKKMGLATIRLSLETTLEGNKNHFGKKSSRGAFLEALENLETAGYSRNEVGVYLLAGMPGQSAGEVADSIDWVNQTGARPYLAFYSPIPGTKLWDESLRLSPYPLEKDPLFHNSSILPCRSDDFNESHLPGLKLLLLGAGRS